jgi:hypothetical protein
MRVGLHWSSAVRRALTPSTTLVLANLGGGAALRDCALSELSEMGEGNETGPARFPAKLPASRHRTLMWNIPHQPLALALVGGLTAAAALAQSDRPWVDPPSGPSEPAQVPQTTLPRPSVDPPPETTAAPIAPTPPQPATRSQPSAQGQVAPPSAPAPAPITQAPQPAPASESRSAPPVPPPVRLARPETPPPEAPARRQLAEAQDLALTYLDYWSAPNAVTLDATPDFYGPRVQFHGRALSARELFRQKQRFVQRWPERSYTVRPDTLRTACAPASETCTVHAVFDFIAVNPARGRRSTGSATLELVVDVSGPRPVIVAETSRIVSRGGVARLEGREDDSLENGDD